MFRWFALAVLLGCLSISTYDRRQARLEAGTIPRHRAATTFPGATMQSVGTLMFQHVAAAAVVVWILTIKGR